MVEKKICNMKYIRTYETEEKFLTDKDSTSRVFRLKPTLYKYSEAGDHVHLELDDPRKHGDSTYMEITLDSDAEFSFYIGNKSGDTQTTMNCSIDWGDGTVETKTVDVDNKGFKLSHSYVAGSYKIELYGVERDYMVVEGTEETGMYGDIYYNSSISPIESVKRVILDEGNNSDSGSVVSIGRGAFSNCSSLTSIDIPESVTSIDAYVFSNSALTSIDIPESVTSIGTYAFKDCSSLTSINIPESITSIGEHAFYGCSFSSVHIPEGVTSIEDGVFYYCSSLTSINIPEGVTSIGEYAFESCSFTSINIPEGVTSIRDGAFSGCRSLRSINIPEGVTSINQYTFASCGSLTSIDIPEGVTSIGTYAYAWCGSLTSIDIPEGVTSIEDYVFYGCSSLKSVHIPEGVTSIGWCAFDRCTSLTSIDIPERVTVINREAFHGCTSLTSISSLNTTAPTLGYNTLKNLSKNGTLHIKPGATGYDKWLSDLPSGWTIVEDL